MVEATTSMEPKGGSQMLSIVPVNKASALGLFREAELVTHIDVVLQGYIAEAERMAQVSYLSELAVIDHCLGGVGGRGVCEDRVLRKHGDSRLQ